MYIEEIKEGHIFLTLKKNKATSPLSTLDFLSTEMAQKEDLWGLSSANRMIYSFNTICFNLEGRGGGGNG